MITSAQYFGAKPHTPQHEAAAEVLLLAVNTMLVEECGWDFPCDPDTGTPISGAKDGNGDGGFRLPTATTGKAQSSHKEARGVDVFDPENRLDNALNDQILARHGLYREHPDSTPGWCHLTTRAPASNNRSFFP